MTVGRTPPRKLLAEQVSASGAHTPTIVGFSAFVRSNAASPKGSIEPYPSTAPSPSFGLDACNARDPASTEKTNGAGEAAARSAKSWFSNDDWVRRTETGG